jgi:hypothetical protein
MRRRLLIASAAVASAHIVKPRLASPAIPHARLLSEALDLLLVLAADVSGSMDERDLLLQQDGYRTALIDPAVLAAVSRGPHGAIGVAYVEWAGPGFQKLTVPWTRIAGRADAQAWGARLVTPNPDMALDKLLGGSDFNSNTSISGGIAFSVLTMAQAPWEAPRRVIDVSGDGADNCEGTAVVEAARDRAVLEGITVNGLVIEGDREVQRVLGPGARLVDYYRAHVVGGPSAFAIEADGFTAFPDAVRRKLVREIAETARVHTDLA